METILDNLKYFVGLYYRPSRAFGDIMDNGSWLFAAIAVLLMSFVVQFSINTSLQKAYGAPRFNLATYLPDDFNEDSPALNTLSDEEFEAAARRAALENYQKAVNNRNKLPVVGDYGLWLFNFNSTNFLGLLLSLALFYVPTAILLMTLLEPIGSFGLVLRRDYVTLLACTLMAWTAAHLPFAVAGLILQNADVNPIVLLLMYLASGIYFAFLMMFALRTVFGANWATAAAIVCLSGLTIGFGGRVFNFISPYLFSPFVLFLGYAYFRGEAATMDSAFRQRQNFRRFLNNATVNPHDAEAHVQLGLLYKQRRQIEDAVKHFNRAIEIESQEIDANYELGKIARESGEYEKALNHFSIVAEQNDHYSTDEIWREIGATYLNANAPAEACEFLGKFIERRPHDPEGLYLYGQALLKNGETAKAHESFQRCIEAAKTSPDYRRGQQRRWAKLAQKELN